MENLRKSKDRRKVVRKSLLENPDMETQAKLSPYLIFLHAFVLIILFGLLVLSYVFVFSPQRKATFGNNIYAGSFTAGDYYQTDSCDLVKIEPYKDVRLAEVGDIVVYATNIEKGSGKLTLIDGDYIELEKTSGELIRITIVSVIGKQVEVTENLGFFPAFLSSYYSVISLTIIILVYIAIITFTRINYENTPEGRELYKQLRKSEQEENSRKKLLSKLKDIDGLDLKIYNVLVGNIEENKKSLASLDLQTNVDLFSKYKYILYKLHRTLIVQQELSKTDKQVITSLIELMCEFGKFDEDMEYMLIDLALVGNLIDFESQSFKESAVKFITGKVKEQDLVNFGSVLYIITRQNKRVMKPIIKDILNAYVVQCQDLDEINRNIALGMATNINNLIK